jgi:hypothetical protein
MCIEKSQAERIMLTKYGAVLHRRYSKKKKKNEQGIILILFPQPQPRLFNNE